MAFPPFSGPCEERRGCGEDRDQDRRQGEVLGRGGRAGEEARHGDSFDRRLPVGFTGQGDQCSPSPCGDRMIDVAVPHRFQGRRSQCIACGGPGCGSRSPQAGTQGCSRHQGDDGHPPSEGGSSPRSDGCQAVGEEDAVCRKVVGKRFANELDEAPCKEPLLGKGHVVVENVVHRRGAGQQECRRRGGKQEKPSQG